MKSAVERLEPGDDGVLGRSVDRRRVVAALPAPQHRLALGPRRQRREDALDVRDAAAAEREPVDRHTGWKSRPLVSFGKKYVVFCGITSPRRARSKTSSMRVGAQQERTVELARSRPRATASSSVGRVAEPLVADEPIDELDVELARLAA